MKYLDPSFTVGGNVSKEYGKGYDETFGKPCKNCGHRKAQHTRPGVYARCERRDCDCPGYEPE